MDFLSGLGDAELIKNFLSTAAQADLTSYLTVCFVIWKVMGKKVSGHFASMEFSVNQVAKEVSELRQAVTADLRLQASRLEAVESRVVELKTRVIRLEQPIGEE
jgi:hypothetical protein